MDIQWWEIVGLIGVALVLSAGKIFEPLRDWLGSFENRANPLRIIGDLLGCSMCCGVWVGFLWGWSVRGWAWHTALILGGCISIAALVADETIGLLALYRLMRKKKSQGAMTMDEMMAARQQIQARQEARRADDMRAARARRRATPRDITEEEADARLDDEEERADAIVLGEPPKVA